MLFRSVQAELKLQPSRTFEVGKYDVEEYRFSRTIPFLQFGSIFAIYENGTLFKVRAGEQPTLESIEKPTGMGVFEQKEKKDLLN